MRPSRETRRTNPTTSDPFEFTAPQFGVKYVQESPEPGWTLTNIVCTANGAGITIGTGIGGTFAQGATAGFDPGDTTVRADVGDDDAPTCTYTNTLLSATITVTKDAVPDAAQDFGYATTGSGGGTFGSGFSLDNDADGTLPASRTFTFTGADATGAKTITESAVAGWTLTNLVCTGGGANTSTAGAVATIGLNPGEAVTCTYTNTQNATITVTKDAVPDAAQLFSYTTTGSGGGTLFQGGTFFLDDDAASGTANTLTFTFTGADATGTKTIQETLPVTGWTLTGLVCSKGTTNLATGLASIALLPGDAVTCTYTNTLNAATLTVTKDAVPDNAQDFAYATTGTGGGTLFASGTFLLDDDADGTLPASRTFTFTGADATGTKTITETVPNGWTLTNLVCTGGGANTSTAGAVATIGLNPGEAVTCTYTNTCGCHDHGHQGRRARCRPGLRLCDDRQRRRDLRERLQPRQ